MLTKHGTLDKLTRTEVLALAEHVPENTTPESSTGKSADVDRRIRARRISARRVVRRRARARCRRRVRDRRDVAASCAAELPPTAPTC